MVSITTASPESRDLGQRLATGSEVRWDTHPPVARLRLTEGGGGRPGSEPRTRGHPHPASLITEAETEQTWG